MAWASRLPLVRRWDQPNAGSVLRHGKFQVPTGPGGSRGRKHECARSRILCA